MAREVGVADLAHVDLDLDAHRLEGHVLREVANGHRVGARAEPGEGEAAVHGGLLGHPHGMLAIERDRHAGQRLGLAVATAHHRVGGHHVADYGGRPDYTHRHRLFVNDNITT